MHAQILESKKVRKILRKKVSNLSNFILSSFFGSGFFFLGFSFLKFKLFFVYKF